MSPVVSAALLRLLNFISYAKYMDLNYLFSCQAIELGDQIFDILQM
jgi:hypothetical protein